MNAAALLAIGIVLLQAGAAVAAGDGDPGGSTLFYQAFNLALLLAVLVYFGRKPIRQFFADRRGEIETEVKNSADLLETAEERFAQWQRKLAELDGELDRIRAMATERAEEERDRIIADAERNAERIRSDSRDAIDQELRRARQTLRDEAATMAVRMAGELVREHVSGEDRDRLLDEFIERVGRDPGANGSA